MTALFDMDGTLFSGDSQLRFAGFYGATVGGGSTCYC